MPYFDVLQFRIHKIRCITPTRRALFETDSDALDLVTIAIDENGDADRSMTNLVGTRFTAGAEHEYSPPLVLYQFDLKEVDFWPRTFFSLVVLAERDDWGSVDDWVSSSLRTLSSAVASALGSLTRRELGRTLSSEELGGIAGTVVTAVVQATLSEVFGALDTDILSPASTEITIASPSFDFGGSAEGATRPIAVTGHGAHYLVNFSWAHRKLDLIAPDEDTLISLLEVIVTTGQDELREESNAYFGVRYTSGEEEWHPLNRSRGWGSHSTQTIRVSLGAARRLGEFAGTSVNFVTGSRGFPYIDTADGWDMNGLVVRYIAADFSGLLFSARGNPVIKFEGRGLWRGLIRSERRADALIALRAFNGQFVVAENGGGGPVLANRNAAAEWETFTLINLGDGRVSLRTQNGHYITAEGGGGRELVANRTSVGAWEMFDMLVQPGGGVAFRASNGKHVAAEGGGGRELVANRDSVREWETFAVLDLRA